MAKTTWGRKETIIWPQNRPIYTYGAIFAAIVLTTLFLYGRLRFIGTPLQRLYTPIYVALGSAAMGYLGTFAKAPDGPAIVWLVAGGGVAYILGAVVYATKWPNPSPRWFGFHEVFHSLTVIGFSCHYIAVSLAAYASV